MIDFFKNLQQTLIVGCH